MYVATYGEPLHCNYHFISDLDQLREDVFTQNLINMAQCSILVEELMPDFVLRRMKLDRKLYVCGHSLCPKREVAKAKVSPPV